jgi:hypothetical protein
MGAARNRRQGSPPPRPQPLVSQLASVSRVNPPKCGPGVARVSHSALLISCEPGVLASQHPDRISRLAVYPVDLRRTVHWPMSTPRIPVVAQTHCRKAVFGSALLSPRSTTRLSIRVLGHQSAGLRTARNAAPRRPPAPRTVGKEPVGSVMAREDPELAFGHTESFGRALCLTLKMTNTWRLR